MDTMGLYPKAFVSLVSIVVTSMFRAAVKLPLNTSSSALSRGSGLRQGRCPCATSIRARARARGSQRLCGLDPEHVCRGTLYVAVGRSARPVTNRTRSAREKRRRAYATFTIAPVGTTPVVRYRQSAITSLRATATMPIRRARFPLPKFVRYHAVRALCGCQRTQFHAS
jgi:hypothetical protein